MLLVVYFIVDPAVVLQMGTVAFTTEIMHSREHLGVMFISASL